MMVFIPKYDMICYYVTLIEGLGMCIHAHKELSRCFLLLLAISKAEIKLVLRVYIL